MIKTLLFFGRSGAGKGTQSQMVYEYLQENGHFPVYIQTGDLVRAYIEHIRKNPRPHEAHVIKEVESGGLLPSFVAVKLWADILLREVEKDSILILDGLCRRVEEAHILDGALAFLKRHDASVIHLDITPEESEKRLLLRGRKDDSKEGIARRLAWYTENVIPAETFFRSGKAYRNYDIDGTQSRDAIFKEIQEVLEIQVYTTKGDK